MNVKAVALLTLGALLVAAPLIAKNRPAPLQSGKYKDWNGNIDEMEIVRTFSLTDYQRVTVQPLDTKAAPLPPAGDTRRANVVRVLNRATSLFVEGMRIKFHPQRPTPIEVGAFVTAAATPAPANAAGEVNPSDGAFAVATPAVRTLLIRGRVTELNPGSRAARYFASFGAGHTDAQITGEVVDQDSGEVLIRFMTGRGSSGVMSPAGGDYETMMSNDTRDDGANVGEMLIQFK